jgi:redox-sensitive bicupin YhaK (pirin superfamily)
MSNIRQQQEPSRSSDCPAAEDHSLQRIATRDAVLGEGMTIRRALPSRQRRMVGAWCFLDHFGPTDVRDGSGLRVGPHPHTGLQTFTWPLAGEILHRDSLGVTQVIRPGQVNLMTAGRGISHSEESPAERSPRLHGAQLWIALPESHRFIEPAFDHYPTLPIIDHHGLRVTLLAGEWLGESAPTRVYTPLIGADLYSDETLSADLPLRPDFEYGLLPLEGQIGVEQERIGVGEFLYLGHGRSSLKLHTDADTRVLLLGGEPFAEDILMWWNFVGRDKAGLLRDAREWNRGDERFGEVRGYDGARIPAPLPPWAEAGD